MTMVYSRSNYTILSEKEIHQRQEEAILVIMNFLWVSRTEAGILLRFFKWSVSKVNDEWFADEERVRRSVGLVSRRDGEDRRLLPEELTCGICFESHSLKTNKATPACGHLFCDTCWTAYIRTAISDGPGCLTLHCADPSCGAAIGEDMVMSLVPREDGVKYTRYLLRNFVENNKTVKWCPAPGCEYAVEYVPGVGSFDIVCKCSHNFCWNCLEEAHRPVDCDTVAKWIFKNSTDSENVNWILANSKPCPKCRRPIEKAQGCMHITCTPPCKFEFCWLCLRPWLKHDQTDREFYACNGFDMVIEEGLYDGALSRREMAKNSLQRYTHYYERWATNESSRTKALSDSQLMQEAQINLLRDKQCQSMSQLKFLNEAWLQIVECRQILKWTYAYGFYLPDEDHAKRQFFEYVQGEAEHHLERLHKCAEKDLQVFLYGDLPQMTFKEFRIKLAGLTSVARTYFENLVRALENGLADVKITR